MKPLHDLRVVELSGSVAGAYCAKMFHDQGATVTLVGSRDLSESQQLYYDIGKHGAALEDVDMASVDVLIESSAPAPLSPIALDLAHLVRVQISPFGMFGPRSTWQGTDLIDYATSGHAHLYGDPNREPLRGPPDQPAVASGLYGFIGAMAALLARDRLGHGQVVEVSHAQVMVALHQLTLLRWEMTGNILTRMGNRYTGQGQPNGPYRCADGWISICCVTTPQVEGLLAVTGLTELLDHPDIDSPMGFQTHPEVMEGPLCAWLADQNVDDTVELLQAMRIPAAPILDTAEVLDDPQLVARKFFVPHPEGHPVVVPGAPFTLSHHQPKGDRGWQPGPVAQGPLSGLQVLDLARVWAGPLCARILSDLGADVTWVEAHWHRGPKQIPQSMLDATRYFPNDEAGERQWNRNTHFVKYSLGKKSLALDMQTPEGQDTFARLVPHAHVVLENFSTRVMPQFGFDEDRLHGLNPDLIYLTMPGFGRSGPAENWLAYGSSVDSHAGLSSLIGYRGEVPWKGGIAWPDPIAGLHAASAVLGSLWSSVSSATGGVTIEAAQFESTVAAIGDRIVQAQIQGPYVPDGNREPSFSAQGVYPCLGDDTWIAVSAPTPESLAALCNALGVDSTATIDHDGLDKAIAAFTSGQQADQLAEVLQAVGVPAALVAKSSDVAADPHLQARSAWVTVDQPDIGDFTTPATPVGLSATPVQVRRPAPTLGQHNDQVLQAAGFTTAEIAELSSSSTIATEPPS